MVGIHTGGAWLAERLHAELGLQIPLGRLDISFYRDDYRKSGLHKSVKASQIPFDVADRRILLVDDVLYTGRTVRAAMNELFDYGRPESIGLAVLIDRGDGSSRSARNTAAPTLAVPEGSMLRLDRDDSGRLTLQLERMRNPQLNANGELTHLLTLEGLPRGDHRAASSTRPRRFVGVTEREVKKVPLLRGKASSISSSSLPRARARRSRSRPSACPPT